MSTASLSIVIPAYNESESLPVLLDEIDAARPSLVGFTEVVVVDDGSTDSTAAVLERLTSRFDWLRTVSLDENLGQTAALAAGFDVSRGDLIATLDADLQNDPSDIPSLLDVLALADADMVTGVRQHRMDSLWKRLQSRIGNGVRNLITGDHISDTGCTLRVSKAPFLEGLLEFDGAHRFIPTLVRIRGGRVVEEPVRHRPRRFGESKYGALNRALTGIVRCFQVRRLRRRALR